MERLLFPRARSNKQQSGIVLHWHAEEGSLLTPHMRLVTIQTGNNTVTWYFRGHEQGLHLRRKVAKEGMAIARDETLALVGKEEESILERSVDAFPVFGTASMIRRLTTYKTILKVTFLCLLVLALLQYGLHAHEASTRFVSALDTDLNVLIQLTLGIAPCLFIAVAIAYLLQPPPEKMLVLTPREEALAGAQP